MNSELRLRDDSGASLILALVFITIGAVVLGATLSFADVSMRTTLQVRDQASNAAAADGAAKVAINALRQNTRTYSSANCFGVGASESNTLALANFYQPATGPAASAAVTCEVDTAHSRLDPSVQVSAANKPNNAILTLATAGEDGLNVTVSGNRTLQIHGDIYSNSTIKVPQGTLSASGSATARGACAGTITSTPVKQCNVGSGADPRSVDPNYPAPTAATTLQPVPTCSGGNKLVTFSPGRYEDITALNNMTKNSGCKDSIFYFPAGTYYFNFNAEWLIDTGYVVGGTPTSTLVAGTPPTMPGSCKSPLPPAGADDDGEEGGDDSPGGWVHPGPNEGVQFVFGGTSRIRVKGAKVELCGSYSPVLPPIALYGLKTAVGPVPAQSGCVTATTYPGANTCAMLKTDQSPNSALLIQGMTYAPKAAIDLQLNNNTGQVIRWGIVARTLLISPTGSADLTGPIVENPNDNIDGGMVSIFYLNVYICPGAISCSSTTGLRRLRIKAAMQDPSGVPIAGAREITIYSWSVLR